MIRIVIISLFFSSIGVIAVHSQDINRVVEGGPALKVGGGVNLTSVAYGASGIESRRDPFSYFLNGNVNFDFYGVSVPLSFSYSNQDVNFQQPFNQFSMSPTYKNITGHLGYSSMNFSKYTLAGHIFFGGGVEVRDLKNFEVSAMYGRLRKAVPLDTADGFNQPSYSRIGYGVKTKWQKDGDFAELTLFHSADDENSISFAGDSLLVFPEENFVIGISAGKRIFEKLTLKFEGATSALTRNRLDPGTSERTGVITRISGPFFSNRTSSTSYEAFNTSLNYQMKAGIIGLGYERIDPGYTTHGAYFFSNDLENVTINATQAFLQQKVRISTNVGLQRNNLDDTELNTMKRFVGSINANVMASKKANLTASYSNFQSFTNLRSNFLAVDQLTEFDNLDTLDFTQISQNATLGANIQIGDSKEVRKGVNVNLSYQTTAEERGDNQRLPGTNFYNMNTSGYYSLTPIKLSFTTAVNINVNDSPIGQTTTWGPTLGVTKSWLENKLRGTLSSSFNKTSMDGNSLGSVLNFRLGGNYQLKEHHSFNLMFVTLRRNTNSETNANSFTEYTTNFTYAYNF